MTEEATFNEAANTQSVPYCVVVGVSISVGRYADLIKRSFYEHREDMA